MMSVFRALEQDEDSELSRDFKEGPHLGNPEVSARGKAAGNAFI